MYKFKTTFVVNESKMSWDNQNGTFRKGFGALVYSPQGEGPCILVYPASWEVEKKVPEAPRAPVAPVAAPAAAPVPAAASSPAAAAPGTKPEEYVTSSMETWAVAVGGQIPPSIHHHFFV